MKIRIHETDFEGHPVECTGEFFHGKTAMDIVEGMKMTPFTASMEPLEFMRQVLKQNGMEANALPEEADAAAVAFLQQLTAHGFAKYEVDDGELTIAPASPCGQSEKKSPVNEASAADESRE
jgi:hypothetical protein